MTGHGVPLRRVDSLQIPSPRRKNVVRRPTLPTIQVIHTPAPLPVPERKVAPISTTHNKSSASAALSVNNAALGHAITRSTTPTYLPPAARNILRPIGEGYDSEATIDIDDVPLNIGSPLERMSRRVHSRRNHNENGDAGSGGEKEDTDSTGDSGDSNDDYKAKGSPAEHRFGVKGWSMTLLNGPKHARIPPSPNSATETSPTSSTSTSSESSPVRHGALSGWALVQSTFGLGPRYKTKQKKISRRGTITHPSEDLEKRRSLWRTVGGNQVADSESDDEDSDRSPDGREALVSPKDVEPRRLPLKSLSLRNKGFYKGPKSPPH